MLQTLKDLFDSLVPPAAQAPPASADHALHLATAVMLVEVMRAAPEIQPAERRHVLQALRGKFDLHDDELARLVELAEAEARASTDYFRFTNVINERFDMAQKIRMIEAMWGVAYADGHLDAHENHVMWRIADLLHVPHGAYISAKMRARDAGGTA